MANRKSIEHITENNDFQGLKPEEYELAKKKLKSRKILYFFMLGLLITGSAILIVYKY